MKSKKNKNAGSSFCIIIPAFNEDRSISKVIEKIRKYNKSIQIVVINDGSTDNTRDIATSFGCTVVDLPFNMGIGPALLTGLSYARENNFNYALQIDADGQHDPKYINLFLRSRKKANLIIGSRFIIPTNHNLSLFRLVVIKAYSILIKLFSGYKIYDPTSGYRLYDSKAMSFLIKTSFNETSDLLWLPKLLKNGLKAEEIPVEMEKRAAGKSSYKTFRILYTIIAVTISILFETGSKNERNK